MKINYCWSSMRVYSEMSRYYPSHRLPFQIQLHPWRLVMQDHARRKVSFQFETNKNQWSLCSHCNVLFHLWILSDAEKKGVGLISCLRAAISSSLRLRCKTGAPRYSESNHLNRKVLKHEIENEKQTHLYLWCTSGYNHIWFYYLLVYGDEEGGLAVGDSAPKIS